MGKVLDHISGPLNNFVNTPYNPLSHLPDSVQNLVYPAVGFAVGGPAGAAAASGASTLGRTGSLKNAALAAGGSYVGGNVGSAYGSSLGTIGSAANAALGPEIGGALGSAIPSAANASLGSAIGSNLGSSLATSMFGDQPSMAGPAPFAPSQQAEASMPSSLGDMGSLSPLQQSTGLATQGVYGGGLGPEEQNYFLNLENRKLVDQSGQTSSLSSLSPIEGSYLQKLGLGGYGDTKSLLQAISQWHPA